MFEHLFADSSPTTVPAMPGWPRKNTSVASGALMPIAQVERQRQAGSVSTRLLRKLTKPMAL